LHITKYILLAPDLSKTSIVQRLQRQSSFVLPRKKNQTSNQLTLQRPVHRGTHNKSREIQYLARFFFILLFFNACMVLEVIPNFFFFFLKKYRKFK
jgi:hypothetical protein